MIKLSIILSVYLLTFSAYAYAEENMPPEKIGWVQRALIPEAIGRLKTLRVMTDWCIYEEKQDHPDTKPCEIAERLRKQSTISDDALMIKTGIKELKAAPQTPVIQQHIRELEAGLGEIMYNLRASEE